MSEVASLVIKVDSRGAKSATRDLDKLGQISKQTETRAIAMGTAIGHALYDVGRGAFRVAGEFIRMADQAANMNARLRLATGSQDAFNKAQRATFRIAQETGSELGSVVELYARLAQSSGELGLSQAEVTQMTESVTQAFIVSGATAQEASGGIRQLTQALAGGTVRAEEFNSILENSPRIVQAMADHFGVSFGKVRQLVNDGKVSSEAFAQAMLASSQKLESEYAQMPLTVSRATQEVRTALLGLVGDTNDTTKASDGLAESIQKLARTLESQEVKDGFTAIVSGIAAVTAEVVHGASLIANYIKQWRELAALRSGGDPGDASMDGLNARLADINAQRRAVRDGKPTSANGFGVADDEAVLARLDAEAREIQREITARIRKEQYDAVFSGTPKEMDFTRGAPVPNKPAGATDEIDKRITKTKELTQAEKDHLQLMQEIEAHDGVVEATQRDLANAYLDRMNAQADADERASQAVADFIEQLQFEASIAGLSNIEQEKAIALRLAGAAATDEQREAIEKLLAKIQRGRENGAAMEEMQNSAKDLFATIVTDSDRASSAIDRFFDNLKRRLAERLFESLMEGFAGMAGGGGWAGFASAFAGAFTGGGRAAGGPVMGGQAYIVGEHGPEVFAPGHSGRVHPMGSPLGGGGARVKLEVINNGPPMEARTETATAPDGTEIVRLIINTVAGDMAGGGRTAQAMQGRFGLRPAV